MLRIHSVTVQEHYLVSILFGKEDLTREPLEVDKISKNHAAVRFIIARVDVADLSSVSRPHNINQPDSKDLTLRSRMTYVTSKKTQDAKTLFKSIRVCSKTNGQ